LGRSYGSIPLRAHTVCFQNGSPTHPTPSTHATLCPHLLPPNTATHSSHTHFPPSPFTPTHYLPLWDLPAPPGFAPPFCTALHICYCARFAGCHTFLGLGHPTHPAYCPVTHLSLGQVSGLPLFIAFHSCLHLHHSPSSYCTHHACTACTCHFTLTSAACHHFTPPLRTLHTLFLLCTGCCWTLFPSPGFTCTPFHFCIGTLLSCTAFCAGTRPHCAFGGVPYFLSLYRSTWQTRIHIFVRALCRQFTAATAACCTFHCLFVHAAPTCSARARARAHLHRTGTHSALPCLTHAPLLPRVCTRTAHRQRAMRAAPRSTAHTAR